MPEHVYTGPDGQGYPHSKDADGTPVGTVDYGDIRDLDEPLDRNWREATDEDRAALPGIAAARKAAADEERFARLVRQLADMGLNAASLGQLAQAAAPKGLQAAEGLIAGGMAAVQQANREQEAAAAAPRRPKPPRSGDQPGTDPAGKSGSEES